MSQKINYHKQAGVGREDRLNKFILLLTLLLVIALSVGIFLFKDKVAELGKYGYFGAFLVTLIQNTTVILPIPGVPVFALGAVLPSPTMVGIAGGTGAVIGEITGFMVGYSGRGIVKSNQTYARLEGWVRRWGTKAIFIFSLIPLFPFDLAGIAAGVLRFPFWKFLLACWLGRILKYICIAWAGAWGWETLLRYLG
ncbi:MAG: VTT domain-containing protein [Dehalococcoidales bacterium]|nr:VTT domain-containing protein [Dehalococcoidales bacterium]